MIDTQSSLPERNSLFLLMAVYSLALLFFFIPAGRFHLNLFGLSLTTGYDAFKLVPIPFLAWTIARRKRNYPPVPFSRLSLPFLALFIFSLITGIASPNGWQALADSLEILFYLGFFFLLIDIPWTPQLIIIPAAGFVIGNLYLGSVAVKQYLAARHSTEIVRLSGTFNHPNELGCYAILGLTLLVWLIYRNKNKVYAFWMVLGAGLLLFAAILSQSRTAILGMVVWVIAAMKIGTPKIRRVVGAVCVASIVGAIFLTPQLITRLYAVGEEIPDPNRINRPLIWYGYLTSEISSLSPFGVGLGPVSTYRFGDWIASTPNAPLLNRAWGPHNTYLAWLAGTGLAGLFLLLWMIKSAWDLIQQCDYFERLLFSAGLLAFLTVCLFQDPLLSGNIPLAWITLIALGDRFSHLSGSGGAERKVGSFS